MRQKKYNAARAELKKASAISTRLKDEAGTKNIEAIEGVIAEAEKANKDSE